MRRRLLNAVALATMFVSVASAQDAKTVVADAQKAMGYSGLNSIEYSGPLSHEGAGLGQWMSPTKGWHANTVKNFTRHIDYAAGTSIRNGLQGRPGDPSGLLPGGAGLDPNNAENQTSPTIAANANYVAKLDITLSPPGFLKLAAAAPNATVKKASMNGKKYNVVSFDSDQKAPSGVPYKLTGYINAQTNMLEKVETAIEDDAAANGFLMGDIVVAQTFSDFKDFNGVKFPTKIVQTRAGVPWNDATVENVKVNGPAPAATAAAGGGRGGGGGAPAGGGGRGAGGPGGGGAAGGGRGAGAPAGGAGGGRGGNAPGGGAAGAQAAGGGRGAAPAAEGGARGGAAAPQSARKIGEGIYVLTGGYRTVAVEMKDGIVLLDAPPIANGIEAMIAQAHQAIPNKPITHVVISHMHFDHTAGLRTVLADGPKPVTVVLNEMDKDVVEQWFKNPHTLQASAQGGPVPPTPAAAAGGRGGAAPTWPDAFAKSGKKVKFQYYKGDKFVMKDAVNTIEIYPLKGAVHSEDMAIIYLPKAKAVYQADAWNPTQPGAATTGTGQLAFQKLLEAHLDNLKLDYNIVVSGHAPPDGRDASKADLMAAIGKK